MAETPIQPAHLPQLAKLAHIGEFLTNEQARIQAEFAVVSQQLGRVNNELHALLQHGYGLDSQHVPVTVDAERGVLVTPDPTPAPSEPQPARTALSVVPDPEQEALPEPS